jgi:hypothetical protein
MTCVITTCIYFNLPWLRRFFITLINEREYFCLFLRTLANTITDIAAYTVHVKIMYINIKFELFTQFSWGIEIYEEVD